MDLIMVDAERCTRCYECVRSCPAQAAHVVDGAVHVDSGLCTGCGSCVRRCAVGAASFAGSADLALDLVSQGDAVAVLSPGFPGAFPDADPLRVVGALRMLGFASVWEAAAGSEILASAYRATLVAPSRHTTIASTCPAAVRLVEAHHPDLLARLAPVVSSEAAASRAARSLGHACVVCIAPCGAFGLECGPRGQDGRTTGPAEGLTGGFDAVLTFSELHELFDESGLDVGDCPQSRPDVAAKGPGRMEPLPAGLLHCLTAMEGELCQGAVSATGLEECLDVLDAVSSGKVEASLVEVSLCRGCVDGPAYPPGPGVWRRRQAVLAYSAAMAGLEGTSLNQRLERSGVGSIDLSRSFTARLLPDPVRAGGESATPSARMFARSGEGERSRVGPDRHAPAQSGGFAADAEPVDMVAYSPAMESVVTLMQKVSNVSSTVLITGASGVGKEVVARYIHRTGNRSAEPFVKINCAAIPETLLESELFGYEEGAFTGARRDGKPGLIELASGGTLFLDEITEMPMSLQAKLLQVLQEKCMVRVGGTRQIRVDARVIAATNRDIERAVREGRFRNDLYYRLNVIPIRVPSLAERAGDIAPLTYHFLEKWGARYGRRRQVSREAREALEGYSWPGNVRELENVLEFLVVTVDAPVIGVEHLPAHIRGRKTADDCEVRVSGIMPLSRAVREVERQLIEHASKTCSSTYSMARALGVNQSTIVRKMQKLMSDDCR